MAGVPSFISDGPWLGLFAFLFCVVLLRAQGTYWAGRWVRRGAEATAHDEVHGRRARFAQHLSGPSWERAQGFLDRWGFVGVPLSFLTIGFQTMVNAAAGYTRMRWDLYTVAMIPGCIAWAIIYSLLGLSLLDAFARSPWLGAGILVGVVALAWGLTRLRRSVGSDARTPR
ncbi:DedA family protein [Demequina zhanjiangensis]|uniref:VTT domain-containing protein n=1 Tax=Demequina zhanjiangensis TaxID=3051659 RepID=A0ABT8G1B6_9MICO|nr:VTT domain-containing protein [Demequina sp. SYSU T00b26]MDN4472519.1 VTT domain-containing protein [Demequina sp. SYSU T00b26]